MAQEIFNRFEIKYFLTQSQYEKLRKILPEFMDSDVYNKNEKPYTICNLYLDTENDELIQTSLEKPVYKEKLRLRSYGRISLDETAYLEIKKKYKGIVNKRRTPIILSEAYAFFEGKQPQTSSVLNHQVLDEIYYIQKRYHANPKVFISYERFAFYEKDNDDFRLTLDTNIISRRENLRLDSEIYGEKIIGKKGDENIWLMEAKAEKAFPLWFSHFLSENKIFPISFSKYGTEFTNYIQKL